MFRDCDERKKKIHVIYGKNKTRQTSCTNRNTFSNCLQYLSELILFLPLTRSPLVDKFYMMDLPYNLPSKDPMVHKVPKSFILQYKKSNRHLNYSALSDTSCIFIWQHEHERSQNKSSHSVAFVAAQNVNRRPDWFKTKFTTKSCL